jgi:AbiU2
MSGVMPSHLAETHHLLFQEVSWLHARWNVYCQLFVSNEQTVDLLNRSAPGFFYICQTVLIDSVLLGISRLTDPAESRNGKGKQLNLSLKRLAATVDSADYPTLRNDIDKAVLAAEAYFSFARALRHKLIAHNDLLVHQQKPVPLPTKADRQKIETALQTIRDIMNLVEERITDSTTGYSMVALPGDGEALIACLQDAESYRDRYQRRKKQPTTE